MPVFVGRENTLTFHNREENTKTDFAQGRIHMSTLRLLSSKALGKENLTFLAIVL